MAPYTHVLLVDPGMSSSFGHHLAYNRELAAAFCARGLAIDILANSRIDTGLLGNVPNCHTVMDWHFFAELDTTLHSSLDEFAASARRFADELHKHATAHLQPGTLFVSHTMGLGGVLGIFFWYNELPPEARPALALNCMLGLDDSPHCAARLALCANSLPQAAGQALQPGCAHMLPGVKNRADGAVRLFAGTRPAAALVAQALGCACAMLPSPLPHLEQVRTQEGPQTPVFGLQGDFRPGKNLEILPVAIVRYIKAGGRGSFAFPMPPVDEGTHPLYLALHDIGSTFPGRVQLDTSYLAPDAYYAALASYSAVLLPYTPQAYSLYRPSGLAIEAAVVAVPVLAAKGGFIENELAPLDNGSLFMEGANAASLVEALLLFEKHAAQRKAKALAAAQGYAALHNAAHVAALLCGEE